MPSSSSSSSCLDQSSGATISIAVHKCGPASSWVGHNLLLRVRQFMLRKNNNTNISKSDENSTSSTSSSNVRFAFGASGKDQNNNSMNMQQMLAHCCQSVDSASFDPMSLSVAGSVPEKFCPPKFLSQVTETELIASNTTSNNTNTNNKTNNNGLPCSETFPALFRWPFSPMSQSDCKSILSQTNGSGGLLALKEEGKTNIIPAINFQKTSAQTENLPFSIKGDLTLVGKTNEVSCGAFLTPNAKEGDLNVVFQCPVDTRKFGIPSASFLGLLNTEREVLVEVAVPVRTFGL